MTTTDFIEKLSDTFERETNQIHLNDAFKEYEEWDSLALLSLMATLEEEYNVTIPRTEFEKIKTVQNLFDYVKSHR